MTEEVTCFLRQEPSLLVLVCNQIQYNTHTYPETTEVIEKMQ